MKLRGVLTKAHDLVTLVTEEVTMEIKVKTDDLVTIAQAAKSLGCARLTVYRWIHAGKIVAIEVAGTLFITKTEVGRLQKERAPGQEAL